MSDSLLTPWTTALLASLPFTISWSLLRFISIELVILSNCLSLCCLFPLLSSIFPSIRVFSNESVLYIRWPRYWIFSFSISPSNEFSGLIFFRIDWFDLLSVQGTLKSLLKNHSLKTSILWHSAFFKVRIVKTVFSSSTVQMWKLDLKEGWVSKNWCFQTVVLEKTF